MLSCSKSDFDADQSFPLDHENTVYVSPICPIKSRLEIAIDSVRKKLVVWTEDDMPSFPYFKQHEISNKNDVLTIRFKHMTKGEIQYDALRPATLEIDLARMNQTLLKAEFIVNRESTLGEIDLTHSKISVENEKWIIPH